MFDASSSVLLHRLQKTALVALSIVFLPLDTSILVISYILSYVFHNECEDNRKITRSDLNFKPSNVLVTEVGMTKGLVLTGSFYEAGHNVVGADFEGNGSLVCGRVSKSLSIFHPLRKPDAQYSSVPYIQSLLDIILKEKIDVWFSCSALPRLLKMGWPKKSSRSEQTVKQSSSISR